MFNSNRSTTSCLLNGQYIINFLRDLLTIITRYILFFSYRNHPHLKLYETPCAKQNQNHIFIKVYLHYIYSKLFSGYAIKPLLHIARAILFCVFRSPREKRGLHGLSHPNNYIYTLKLSHIIWRVILRY